MSFEDILRIQGVNSKGFGIIPKLVMQDCRLSIQAKAIYSYFCSFAGTGNTAFPSVSKIMFDLQIKDKHTFYRHRKMLEDCGYLKVEKVVEINGRFGRNIYTLISKPSISVLEDSISDSQSKIQEKPINQEKKSSQFLSQTFSLKPLQEKLQEKSPKLLKGNNIGEDIRKRIYDILAKTNKSNNSQNESSIGNDIKKILQDMSKDNSSTNDSSNNNSLINSTNDSLSKFRKQYNNKNTYFKDKGFSRKNKDSFVSQEALDITIQFKEIYGADLDKRLTQKMIDKKGIDTVTMYLNCYSDYLQNRNVRNITADFYNCVMNEYQKPITSNNLRKDYANFEQRKYDDDFWEQFYYNPTSQNIKSSDIPLLSQNKKTT